jgi:4-amino-4-deoxy-L-arabinose transferase-like glycosyltransferase
MTIKKKTNHFHVYYLFLLFILLIAAFVRLYKIDKLLGFWYDQGRDALVIWDLLHYKKFFLIGPTTGIEGIFKGPLYYYLITPFYWLGKGSPVMVAAFLSWLSVAAIFLIYYLASKIYNPKVGLLAATLYGFSYENAMFSRWLSEPNAVQFFAVLAMLFLYKAIKENENYFIPAVFVVGLCLHFESAVEIFFLPVLIIIVFWQRKKLLKPRLLILAVLAFLITVMPQLLFDMRHHGVLTSAFVRFLLVEKSFNPSLINIFWQRMALYRDVFFEKIFPSNKDLRIWSAGLLLISLVAYHKKIFNEGGKLLMIFIGVPLVGLLFYRGNNYYVWGYYFSSLIPAFTILVAIVCIQLFQRGLITKTFLLCIFLVFIVTNWQRFQSYFKTGTGITLQAQLKAIDWIYQDADKDDFNADFYVPPKIYYSYTYLFRWYGLNKYGREPLEKRISLLYTLSEPDGWNPNFLKDWYARQEGIGKVTKKYFWGDISIERRQRIKFND